MKQNHTWVEVIPYLAVLISWRASHSLLDLRRPRTGPVAASESEGFAS